MQEEMKLSEADNTSSTSCEKILNNNTSFVSSTSSSESSSSEISLTQQQEEQRVRSFTKYYPQETHLQQEEEKEEESYEYDAGKSMSEISTSISLSSSKLRHLSHSPPIKSHSVYSSNISPPTSSTSSSSSLKQSENERERENTEDLQKGAEKYWSGLYSGATDLFSLAMLSSMEEEHNIRELRLRFEQCVEQIHCSLNYIRRNGLHEALLLLHTAQTQSALESALLASSCAKAKNKNRKKNKNKYIKHHKQNCSRTNLGRSKSTEITNVDYHEEEEEEEYGMSAMRSNRRTRMTSTPTLLQLPPSHTTAIAGNETEEMIITPFDGMRANVLNDNGDNDDLVLESETWRLLQNALCKVDVISVLFEKILQLRIDLRTRMSMAALSATPSIPVVTPAATPTTSNESQSAFSYAGFSANTPTIVNSNNYNNYNKYNSDSGSSIKLTEDEALLWSSVTHVDPLRVQEQAQLENYEIFSSSSSSSEEYQQNEEKNTNAEKHMKYNSKEFKRTIEHKELHNMDATSPIVELKGNKELVNMFRNMKEMADLNHKDSKNASSGETLSLSSPHKEIINANKEKETKEEQNKGIATEEASNADNKNEVIINTTETKSNKLKDKFHNMVHYPPRLPHVNLQQSLTRVTFVEQLYALRLLQGFSLTNPHQRYLIGHSCFLWYATELYECFVQHVEAIARINRLQAQQRELRREYKEKIWVELQQCKRELAYNKRRLEKHQNKEYYHTNDLSLTLSSAASLSSSSSSSFVERTQEPHNEIEEEEEEEEPLHIRSLSSLSSSSSCVMEECDTKEEEDKWKTNHPFHTQSISLPASLIRRQRWRTQAQQNVHSTMRSLQFNKDNNYVANIPIKRSSYYNTNRHNNHVFTSQSSREAQRNMNMDFDGNNSAHWVSHTRSQSFNVEPIHLRSFSLQSIHGRDKVERIPQNNYCHYRGDINKELKAVNVMEKKIKQLEEELREITQEEKREEDEEIEERRHFAVRADQVEVMMALTDALESLCHYNSYALNKLISSNTLETMLNIAFCPMVHEPLRLSIFNTVSVLLQELATFRQASQLLINAPESNFSRTLSKEPHSILEFQRAKDTQNINDNNCSETDVEVNYIGSNDYSVLQAMLENANMIDVRSDSNINETRTRDNINIDSSNTRNNNKSNINNKFKNKATTSPYSHKFRNEQSCGFTFDINVANKFETAVKEWLITHGLMHLFASLCELHTLREWELLQDVTSFSYTGNTTTKTKKNRSHGYNKNDSKNKAEMSQAELQRQMQRSRHLREHQQRAFLQAVDGKRAEIK